MVRYTGQITKESDPGLNEDHAGARPGSLRITHYALRITRSSWLEPLVATLFFTALAVAMTWPWALYMGEAINPFGDVVVQMTSLRWNAHALLTNPAGLFEAPFFYPYAHSLTFSENLLGQTITALPLLWLTGNPALAANIYILLSFVLTGLFTYLLVRDLTGSRAAGVLSGVAFAFCPFRFMQMGHLHMLATQWFPFTLWALGRALGAGDRGSGVGGRGPVTFKPSNVQTFEPLVKPFSGLAVGLAAFGFVAMTLSSIYYTFFLALVVTLYTAWWIAAEPKHGVKEAGGGLVFRLHLAGLVVGVALGVVFVPYGLTTGELGFSRSIYEVQNWAAEWSFYGNVLQSNWLYGKVLAPGMVGLGGERELFPGIAATLLALAGLIFGRGRTRFFYLLLGLFSLLLTFGLSGRIPGTSIEVPLPYALLYDWVPGFKALRVPVRFAVLVDFSIYVLAGYGLAWMLRVVGERSAIRNQKPEVRNQKANLVTGHWSLVTSLTALVLLEFINPLDTANRRDVAAQLQVTEPYGWLARPENAGPVLELPMTAGQDDVWYTFFGTRHWQPLVNGWSSFVPPGTVRLKQALDGFPDPYTVSLLQGLEVRHVVVHLWQFPREVQADLKSRLDGTPQLEMVNQAGDNYVYRLASDPWLREVARRVGDGTLWVGEARRGSMPTLEVLAYALGRWGVPPERIAGNIDIGYRPLGSLPFGTPADYALLPGLPGADDAPFGYDRMQPAWSNGVARLLKRDPALVASYDLTLPDAPGVDHSSMQMGVSGSSVAFDREEAPGGPKTERTLSLSFVAFAPSEATVQIGSGEPVSLSISPGVSTYESPRFEAPQKVVLSRRGGDARLLRVDLREAGPATGALANRPELVPLEVMPSKGGPTLDTHMRLVAPQGGGGLTATIDVYVEPWGTHPEGHFGSWSVPVPADGAGHEYVFYLGAIAKSVSTTRDGQPAETFAWVGPPSEGDFRAALVLSRGDRVVANVPLFVFTLRGARLSGWDLDPGSLSIVHPGEE
jgi:hypothetical protein